ncbi:MAG: DUF962 domain-containing protein [Flavobacteriales bacterium]|nr:DUF962 domain-containing protein [Flavobacteriales bacterium]
MAARSIHQWFADYGVSHQNPTNKAVHWVCVPVIYFCVVGFLWSIPTPEVAPLTGRHVWAMLGVALVSIFYMRLSLGIMIGMAIWSILCLFVCRYVELHATRPLWAICVALFVAAWIGQFIGHKIEGKKPSFLHDLQFLIIGPAWLMGVIYRKLGIPY